MEDKKPVQIWSKEENAIVEWSVGLEEETDEGGNIHKVIIARHADEVFRFSPNTTPEELDSQIAAINKEGLEGKV